MHCVETWFMSITHLRQWSLLVVFQYVHVWIFVSKKSFMKWYQMQFTTAISLLRWYTSDYQLYYEHATGLNGSKSKLSVDGVTWWYSIPSKWQLYLSLLLLHYLYAVSKPNEFVCFITGFSIVLLTCLIMNLTLLLRDSILTLKYGIRICHF